MSSVVWCCPSVTRCLCCRGGSGPTRDRGFSEALVLVSMDGWVHQLADFRAVFAGIGVGGGIGLVYWQSSDFSVESGGAAKKRSSFGTCCRM